MKLYQKNFLKACKFYRQDTYDSCKEGEIEKRIFKTFNCTVPYLTKSRQKVCNKREVCEKASNEFYRLFYSEFGKCPSTCTSMKTYFGYPSISKENTSTGFVRFYFKRNIKITEDFVSYDLLR